MKSFGAIFLQNISLYPNPTIPSASYIVESRMKLTQPTHDNSNNDNANDNDNDNGNDNDNNN